MMPRGGVPDTLRPDMSEGTGYSNSIRAGAFLLTGALLGLVIILVLSKTSAFSRMNEYVVVFTMEDGVGGVEIGSEVRVAGLKVGRVTEIVQKFDEQRIEVEIEMRADIALHKDAVVIRSQPLLGNFSWLNFSSLGTEAGGRMNPGDAIDARKSGGLLATIVGPANASNADRMFADLVAFTGALNDFAKVQYPERVLPILRDANQTVSKLSTDYEAWRPKIAEGLGDAASSMRKLDATMDDVGAAAKDARESLAHLKEKNLKQIDDLLESGVKGADRFASAMDTLDAELGARIPDLRALLWDLRQAGAQVKLASMEVRRSPWKLLYRPSGDELGRENLYESARAFAIASSDLRVAGETFEAALRDSPDRFTKDARFRDAIQGSVIAAIDRYDVAQKRLFDVLQADFKGMGMPASDQGTVAAPIDVPAPAAPAPAGK